MTAGGKGRPGADLHGLSAELVRQALAHDDPAAALRHRTRDLTRAELERLVLLTALTGSGFAKKLVALGEGEWVDEALVEIADPGSAVLSHLLANPSQLRR